MLFRPIRGGGEEEGGFATAFPSKRVVSPCPTPTPSLAGIPPPVRLKLPFGYADLF